MDTNWFQDYVFRIVHLIVLLISVVILLDFALNVLLDLLLLINLILVCFVMFRIVFRAQLKMFVRNVLVFSMLRMEPASAPPIPS